MEDLYTIHGKSWTKEEIMPMLTGLRVTNGTIVLEKINNSGCDKCYFSPDGYNTCLTFSGIHSAFGLTQRGCSNCQYIRVDNLSWFDSKEKLIGKEPAIPEFLPHGTITYDGKYRVVKSSNCHGCVFEKIADCAGREKYTSSCVGKYNMSFIDAKVSDTPTYPKFIKNSAGEITSIEFSDGKVIKADFNNNDCSDCWFHEHNETICERLHDINDDLCTHPRASWIPVRGFDDYREDWKESAEEEECVVEAEEEYDNEDIVDNIYNMNNGGSVIVRRQSETCKGCYFRQESTCKKNQLIIDGPDTCNDIIFELDDEPDPDIGTRVTFKNGDSALCEFTEEGCFGCCFDNGGCSDVIGCSDVSCNGKIYTDYRESLVNEQQDEFVLSNGGTFGSICPTAKLEIYGTPVKSGLTFKKEKKFSL